MTTQESGHKQERIDTPKTQAASPKKKQPKKKRKSGGSRVLAFIAKWIFIIFCFLFSIVIGLVVGYSILGEGSIGDVFNIGTWKHLYDLIFTT